MSGVSERIAVRQTVLDDAEALRRQRFAKRVVRELEELQNDQAAWVAYLEEAEVTHLTDGIG